jgi:DNA-binding LytR/AlgR family response regulator
MIRIAIVEDERRERAHLRDCLAYIAEKEQLEFDIVEFGSGEEFLGGYQPVYDIVLMDIELPGINGMETAKALRRLDSFVLLVFVTNMVQYAVSGYEVDALNYILKPVNRFDFALKMNKAISRTAKRTEKSVQIRAGKDLYMLPVAAIRYLEVDGHYIVYHTTEGDYSEYITLKEAEKKLNKPYFVRCNRCYLVNLKYVSAVRDDVVQVGRDELLISRPQKKAFLNALAVFIGGVN